MCIQNKVFTKKSRPQPFRRGCFIRFAHIEMVRDSAAMVHWWTLEIKGYNVHMEMAFNSNPSYPASRDNVVPLEKHSQSPPKPVLHPPAVQCASPKLNLATWPLCWPLSACYLPKCKKAILWARHSSSAPLSLSLPSINTQWHNQGVDTGAVQICIEVLSTTKK